MRLLIIGHSWVSNLQENGLTNINIVGQNCEVHYICKPGKRYQDFSSDSSVFEEAANFNPDYIVVILVGNSILGRFSNTQIREWLQEFYTLLRRSVPAAKILATECEQRFYQPGNRFGAPVGEAYRLRRVAVSNLIRRLRSKDHILRISETAKLDNIRLYKRDGVHLNTTGIKKLWGLLIKGVEHAHRVNPNNQ